MGLRKDAIPFTTQKTHGERNHLVYGTINPDLVDESVTARNNHYTYGQLQARGTLCEYGSVKDHMKHHDLSGYMTVRERMQLAHSVK